MIYKLISAMRNASVECILEEHHVNSPLAQSHLQHVGAARVLVAISHKVQ